MVDEDTVWQALETVDDPELPLSIVDMGLIYGVQVEPTPTGAHVQVRMTFTAMGCPAMGMLREDVRQAVGALDEVEQVDVRVVWDPPWTVERLSERARAVLETAGVGV